MNAKSRQHEIDRFLRFGEHDLLFRDWPGENLVERLQQGHDALIEALVSEIRRRQQELTFPIPERNLACDLASFAREKFAPMVHGLFPRREWAPVLAVLERSVVFLTASDPQPVRTTGRVLTATTDPFKILAVQHSLYERQWRRKTKAEEYERCKSQ